MSKTIMQENFSLKTYNTFGIDASAKYFAAFKSIDELKELLNEKKLSTFNHPLSTTILGGGSNILFTKDFDGLVLKNEIGVISIIKEDADHVYVKAGAGESWHGFVIFCLNHGLAGVENLSLIPGSVGASPMQNIGAYGVEIKDVFHSLEAHHRYDDTTVYFSNTDCEFGYRESIFKNRLKDQFVITNVIYRLNKKPRFNTSYGAIEQELEKMGVQELNIQSVSQAVINIRQSKLPDPKVIGNAGSFFKNPEIAAEKFEQLKEDFPSIVGYPLPNDKVKLAAGWLIEQCGWKGYRKGDAGCHAKQALVLVNYGHANGNEILQLSNDIINSVQEKFGVMLNREVNII
ncbi:UDP-N-acetylmuramate dehydrogenase [Ferruginibacter sp. HRS2-29]|uniref:UDP-N-acetylmuramate dehydrogenase n=1 Tax=Ferruginibacter sp. HRS2-29 TaxID=2487334 RepID=UPI0020CE6235|nr:UDP-N-acetylmuramate dehydrogenase [Ferruginibacter sp. HRS2-29]MCP9752321.1 UDP-N-acetylmuramate dehydrogenase [Ferruginibacter sp. HRS2-29]